MRLSMLFQALLQVTIGLLSRWSPVATTRASGRRSLVVARSLAASTAISCVSGSTVTRPRRSPVACSSVSQSGGERADEALGQGRRAQHELLALGTGPHQGAMDGGLERGAAGQVR
jgi:hypothetical protein